MPQIADLLAGPLQLGDPDVSGPLTVFPVFGAPAPMRFSAFANAACNGLTVTELPGGASVNDLVVENALDEAVLIFEARRW